MIDFVYRCTAAILLAMSTTLAAVNPNPITAPTTAPAVGRQIVGIEDYTVPLTIHLAWCPGVVPRHSVILMLGSLDPNHLPEWSTALVDEGYMLAAFTAAYPPDPDPAKRPQWLVFDPRFAHGYALGAERTIKDTARVIDYLQTRPDVDARKIGWLGSSSTAIPGLAVATAEPRLTAVVAFVATGAYRQWFDTWQPNGLTTQPAFSIWPETDKLLKTVDPILHVDQLYPKAILMVSGGNDRVVAPATARAFVEAARPYYAADPERLQLVIYDGFGHNLPRSIIPMFAELWFRRYIHPLHDAPPAPPPPANLSESVKQTQINAAEHKNIVGGQ